MLPVVRSSRGRQLRMRQERAKARPRARAKAFTGQMVCPYAGEHQAHGPIGRWTCRVHPRPLD
eukprot:6980448-Lingulodinium_polyedra.AAC.1